MANAHQKTEDPQREYYMKQKKNLEINPKHPVIKELLRRVKDDAEDEKAKDIALMMFRTGKGRSLRYVDGVWQIRLMGFFVFKLLYDRDTWSKIRTNSRKPSKAWSGRR